MNRAGGLDMEDFPTMFRNIWEFHLDTLFLCSSENINVVFFFSEFFDTYVAF